MQAKHEVFWAFQKKEWRAREAAVTYALRQLKSPLSNINRLDNHLVMSTGADVILCVIPAMTKEVWSWHHANLSKRKPPRWVTTNTTSKKGLKGRLVVVVTVVDVCFFSCIKFFI